MQELIGKGKLFFMQYVQMHEEYNNSFNAVIKKSYGVPALP